MSEASLSLSLSHIVGFLEGNEIRPYLRVCFMRLQQICAQFKDLQENYDFPSSSSSLLDLM